MQGDDASAYEAVGCGSAQTASTVYDLGVGSLGNMDDFLRNAGEGERSFGIEGGPSD